MARSGVDIAEIASLMGDVARAHMLAALMDGRALTALELALTARVTPQTASSHLAKLREANLLAMKAGASPLFPLGLAARGGCARIRADACRRRPAASPAADAHRCGDAQRAHLLRSCRRVLSVGVTDSRRRTRTRRDRRRCGRSDGIGVSFLTRLGVDLTPRQKSRRIFCRPCLDWSERRPHLAGHVGAALCAHFLNVDWVRRTRESRALKITPLGREKFAEVFGVVLQKRSNAARSALRRRRAFSPSPRAGACRIHSV